MAHNTQWVMLEKLFEAHLGPVRDDIREMKGLHKDTQKDVGDLKEWRANMNGRILGFSAAGGGFGSLVIWLFKGMFGH